MIRQLEGIFRSTIALSIAAGSAVAQVNVAITADNAYSFGYGTQTSITNLFGGVENTGSAATIFSCATGPETYSNIPAVANGFLYIIAYADNGTTQGVLGQFVSTTNSNTVFTGTSAWQVFATGLNYDPGSGGPTLAIVNAQIAAANSNSGGAGSSVGWVGISGGAAGTVGTLAIGEANDTTPGTFGQVCPTTIGSAARWMWYNPNATPNPFQCCVAGEFLIFRLPTSQVTNPRLVAVNKDIENTTGMTATGVDILLEGHHTQISDIFHAATPNFTVVQSGANDLLRWSGGNIPPGGVVHVGFKMPEQSVNILGLFMTNNGVSIGCAHQLNSNLHIINFSNTITYKNSVTACESIPLYVGNISLHYFENEVDLALMNGTSSLSPIHVDNIGGAPVLVNPGSSASVVIPAPPPGGAWVMARYTVSASPTLAGPGNTEDFIQFPAVPSTLFDNPGFVFGNVPGFMPTGAVTSWTVATGSPRVFGTMGCEDLGYVQLRGNFVGGDSIRQVLPSPGIAANHKYRLSFCARKVKTLPFGAFESPVRFRVTASNGSTSNVIGTTSELAGSDWTTVTLCDWVATQNYSSVTIRAENGTQGRRRLRPGTAAIDNVRLIDLGPVVVPCASAFCFGDGSGAPCPCANGSAGRGCANSSGVGALLTASGTCSVAANSLNLTCTGMIPGAFCLFRQGTEQVSCGLGQASPFTDGLDCISGSVVNLGRINTLGGTATLSNIVTQGGIPPGGGTRHYQVVYQNHVSYCTPATLNGSNGLTVNWVP